VEEIYGSKSDNDFVKVEELQTKLKLSKMTVTRWLRPALDNGWIEDIGEKRKGKPFKLVPGNFEENEVSLLPSVETLAEKFPELALNFSVIDPVSGKQVKAERD
jgi:transposase